MPSNRGLSDRRYRARRAATLRRNPVCWLCGKRIDLTLPPTHPMGPTIDHTIARKLGGRIDAANERPAHRRCNSAKGAKPARPEPVHSRPW